MAIYGQPARIHKNLFRGVDGLLYNSAERAAKGSPTPRRDAAKAKKNTTKFLGLSALDALRKISSSS